MPTTSNLQLARNTHVYLHDGTVYWKLPVLDGFSFSQATATTEVSANEMADADGNSRRGRALFTDAFEPAEWSFQMHMKPFENSAVDGGSVEEPLWASFINAGAYTHSTRSWANAVTRSSNAVTYDFDDSNSTTLGTFTLFFVLGACGTGDNNYSSAEGQTIYRIENCVVNSATMDFDIDSLATISWSGFGDLISERSTLNLTSATVIEDGITSNSDNYIRNRLTSLTTTVNSRNQDTDSANEFAAEYKLTLTGGSISFENNITFLTPEELCTVNQPVGHVTGVRTVGGNFTCYLNDGSYSDGSSTSADLFNDLATATDTTTNKFDLVFSIGGASNPKVVIDIPTAHLEIPTHSIDDIISLETNFHALPTDLGNTDEATIKYHAA